MTLEPPIDPVVAPGSIESVLDLPGLGPTRTVATNGRLALDDPAVSWVVTAGEVRVFAVELVDGRAEGPMHPLTIAPAGALIYPSTPEDSSFGLCLVGVVPGTEARPIARAELHRLAVREPTVVQALERFVGRMASSVAGVDEDSVDAGSGALSVAVGDEVALAPGDLSFARHPGVWVPMSDGLTLWGRPVRGIVPLPIGAPLECERATTVVPLNGAAALSDDRGWEGLDAFVAVGLELLGELVEQRHQMEIERLARLAQYESELRVSAYTELGSVLDASGPPPRRRLRATDDLLAACRVMAAAAGIELVEPPPTVMESADDPVALVARYSRMRARQVAFTDRWWRSPGGPLLAQRGSDGGWVALVPRGARGYDLVDALEGERRAVDGALAATLVPAAIQFYRPLPREQVTGRGVLRFVLRDVGVDLRRLLIAGMLVGLLSLLPTIVAGVIFDTVVPAGDRSRLLWLVAVLVGTAVAIGGLTLVQSLSGLRLVSKGSFGLQAAVFDRLLDLPPPFFRSWMSADLAARAMGIESMATLVSQYLVPTVLAAFITFFNAIILFVIEPVLAVFAIVAVLIGVVAMLVAFRVLVRRQDAVRAANGQVVGLGVQILGAVPKLRVAHAERRAFAAWVEKFATLKRASTRAGRALAVLTSFIAAWVPLATALVFIGVATLPPHSVSPGSFLAFNTSFTEVVASMVILSISVSVLAAAVPYYTRLRPLFETAVETAEVKADPGVVRGAIDVSHVSYHYDRSDPLVLDDVSFSISPGELVAIVGPSGSGKSTLLRLLLGFDQPVVGTISYDQQDLSGLDVRAVRRQCGVVVQGAQMTPDDVFHNIIGTRNLTMDDAWVATRFAGIDDYVRSLPMGMHTVVNEYGGAFSGGQRQLLLLARAVAAKPRVIFLDEATSALDNRSQAVVMRNIEEMHATRVIIAHRLSTIRNADRILVLDDGRLVQQGTYDELVAEPDGTFARLVHRQSL
ncbi:MAG: NHLP bacteriocin export ABC transporter permease/ATPase subunit [Acidimicrobiales bacterium]